MATVRSPPRPRVSYKDRIDSESLKYSEALGTLSEGIRRRFENYASALKGEHEYVDSKGKTVKARTYRKRLEFAEEELSSIETNLALQKRYGKLTDEQAVVLSDYIHSVHDIAIKNNAYLKSTNLPRSANSRRLRNRIRTLDDRIVADTPNSGKMNAPTGYTNFLLETISSPVPDKPETISDAEREKSTSGFTIEKVITMDAPARQAPSQNADDYKLRDDDIPAWPFSAEEIERMQRKKRVPREYNLTSLFGKVALAIGSIAAAAGLAYLAATYKNNSDVGSESVAPYNTQSVPKAMTKGADSHIVTGKAFPESQSTTKPSFHYPDFNERWAAIWQPSVRQPSADHSVTQSSNSNDLKQREETEAKQLAIERVKKAKEAMALEHSKKVEAALQMERESRENIKRMQEESRKRESARKTSEILNQASQQSQFDNSQSFRRKDPNQIILEIWDKRSRERAKNNFIAKEATFYPDGRVEVRYPNGNGTAHAYSMR